MRELITFIFDGYTFNYTPSTGAIEKKNKYGKFKLINQPTSDRYIRIGVTKGNVLAHRLAFYAVHEYMPDYVDHINGLKHDNRILNLRAVTAAQNSYNVKKRGGKSGYKNVYYETRHSKWFAKVVACGKQVYGPLRDTAELASLDARTLRTDLHKEFANHG